MFRLLNKYWLWVGLFCLCGPSVFGFVLGGPINEPYQITAIGYNVSGASAAFGNMNGNADIAAPKNFGQGYRWNVPVVYYAYDASFASFFGPYGMAECDKAFALFNSLSNVSSYSSNLTEWPLTASRANPAAEALGLSDLKSSLMGVLIEELGLMQPDRFVWCLHDRYIPAGAACPNYDYFVIQRNFDPVTRVYSSFVNNALYGFSVQDACPLNPNPYAPLLADAVEYNVDPRTIPNKAVASQELFLGNFYTGLTRDDIGGLRDLLAATNVFRESTGSNINQAVQATVPSTLVTQDYSNLLYQATINNAAALAGLFPGLIVTSETASNVLVVTTNTVAVLVPAPLGPVGSFTTSLVTTYTTNYALRYTHAFGNVVPVHVYTNAFITLQTTTVGGSKTGPVGTLATNVSSVTSLELGVTNGDFYILPTTLCGDYVFIPNSPPIANITSNITALQVTTNVTLTNTTVTANIVTYATNYTYSVFQVTCVPNTVNLREGIEKITFIRQDFDSILGTSWTPVTNYYNQTAVTNGLPVLQTFRRIITQPDILFSTADLTGGPQALPTFSGLSRSFPAFNTNQVAANQFGPGTVQPAIQFVYNNVGRIFENGAFGFTGVAGTAVNPDANFLQFFQWGSFDSSTNAPVIYPSTASLSALEAQIFFQITTPSPLVYSLSAPFSVQLMASGGTRFAPSSGNPPYLWPTSNITLPAGLTLSNSGVLSGTLTGVTTNTPPIVFNVEAEDAGGRVTEAALTLVIAP